VERMREADGISGRLDGRRGRLIGNAVAVPMAEWFARAICLAEAGTISNG
jgi:DNA (cytosine-5)-methyltransferase 1